jgi:hypothetical protein
MTKTIRCKACGKPVDAESKGILRLARGGFNQGANYTEKTTWGFLHEVCFLRAVDIPSLALEQIRKASKNGIPKSAKHA